MKKILFLSLLLAIAFLLFLPDTLEAQCAMCKATAEQGDQRGLNMGILYLFGFPYLIVGTIAYFWWRNRKENKEEDSSVSLPNWDKNRMN